VINPERNAGEHDEQQRGATRIRLYEEATELAKHSARECTTTGWE